MSDHDRIVILLSRQVAGELTPAETDELRLALESVSDAPPKGMTALEERMMLEKGLRQWKQPSPIRHLPVRSSIRTIVWSAAAAVVLLVAIGIFFFRQPRPQTAPVVWQERTAKYGTRNYIDLPDGSRMWLNAGSKVQYADGFSDGKRELTLKGEAYFDIKHKPETPFLIHVGNVDVKVLGTSLNVKAYPGDSTIETTLIQGKAEIEVPGKNSPPIMLQPGEKITLPYYHPKTAIPTYQRNKIVTDPTYKTIIETSWVEDKLVFRKEPFQQVASKLERWYNIRILFKNDKYQNEELTGYFKDQPIKNVMDALQLSLGFHYEIAGDSILIK